MRCLLRYGWLCCFFLLITPSARAQLATSFYNVTGIETRVLPNAVQLTIQTDGTVAFGGDQKEFVDIAPQRFSPKEVTAFRIRLVNARARMPAFVDFGKYPVDSAVVTLGTDDFTNPVYSNNAWAALFGGRGPNAGVPRVDIELRFFVPVTVQRFIVERYAGRDFDDDESSSGVDFGEYLGPRDVSVELGRDRRSILVTIMSDRVDLGGADRVKRSPPEQHRHRLKVTPLPAPGTSANPPAEVPPGTPPTTPPVEVTPSSNTARATLAPAALTKPSLIGASLIKTAAPNPPVSSPPGLSTPGPPATRFRLDVLHTPLAEVVDAVTQVTGVLMLARSDAATVDVSLFLPETTPEEFLRTIEIAYGLVISRRSAELGGGYEIGRGGNDLRSPATALERVQLRYLEPEQARLLLPDFLLPMMRADRQNNSLIIAGPPALVARVRSDLSKLDVPRAQARVEVTAWEFSTTADMNYALNVTRTVSDIGTTVNSDNGTFSLRLEENQQRALSVAIQALQQKGRVRLVAKPYTVVTSGREGTLFLGQTRFIRILRQRGREQVADALRLDIGYSLEVRPTVGAENDITLELNPRLSTVDAIDNRTGLPTVGIREVNTVIRVRPEDAVLIAGLDSDLRFDQKGQFAPFKPSPILGPILSSVRKNRSQTALVLLVTARRV